MRSVRLASWMLWKRESGGLPAYQDKRQQSPPIQPESGSQTAAGTGRTVMNRGSSHDMLAGRGAAGRGRAGCAVRTQRPYGSTPVTNFCCHMMLLAGRGRGGGGAEVERGRGVGRGEGWGRGGAGRGSGEGQGGTAPEPLLRSASQQLCVHRLIGSQQSTHIRETWRHSQVARSSRRAGSPRVHPANPTRGAAAVKTR